MLHTHKRVQSKPSCFKIGKSEHHKQWMDQSKTKAQQRGTNPGAPHLASWAHDETGWAPKFLGSPIPQARPSHRAHVGSFLNQLCFMLAASLSGCYLVWHPQHHGISNECGLHLCSFTQWPFRASSEWLWPCHTLSDLSCSPKPWHKSPGSPQSCITHAFIASQKSNAAASRRYRQLPWTWRNTSLGG